MLSKTPDAASIARLGASGGTRLPLPPGVHARRHAHERARAPDRPAIGVEHPTAVEAASARGPDLDRVSDAMRLRDREALFEQAALLRDR